jgi:hypothetical protein
MKAALPICKSTEHHNPHLTLKVETMFLQNVGIHLEAYAMSEFGRPGSVRYIYTGSPC